MRIDVRVAREHEHDDFSRTFLTAILENQPSDALLEKRRPGYLAMRPFGAYESGEMIGTAGAWPFDMSVPGGARVAVAAVTAVGVLPTHTRRGVLTRMMRAQLTDAAELGQPIAILGASESVIYGRFGYGLATTAANLKIRKRHSRFATEIDDPGRSRLVDREKALEMLPAIYDRYGRGRPGSLNRPAYRWERWYGAPIDDDDDPPNIFVIHEDAKGRPDGFLVYALVGRKDWDEKGARIEIHDLWGDPSVYGPLWRYALEIDLVDEIEAWMRMPDEPLRWMLADPRRLETKLEDHVWLRVLDVPFALTARTYAGPGRVVLDIADPFLDRGGRFDLDVDETGAATCKSSKRAADLELSMADLGAAYLGGHSFHALAAAGRVRERKSGALSRADRLFAHHPAPWCGTFF
jgi:predicted acetyltransferase